MSKQKGIIKLEGNLGGISFYTSDGQALARVATGPSKERIAKDPAFKRTRENNTEFGGSAKVAKSLRLSMGGLIGSMAGTRFVAQLTAMFKKINLKGTGSRGKRTIKLSANKTMLKNMEFNKKLSFNSVFSAPFTCTADPDRHTGTITVSAFNPDGLLNAPAGATHFKLVSALGVISDYLYDDGVQTYEAVVPDQDTLGANAESALLPIDANVAQITLSPSIEGQPVVDSECSVIQTLGIQFYQEVDNEYYLFAQDNAMKIVNVY